ncbi:MAG TPA: ZIP family metal transporter [Candidatus Saccharimonadales bacterium]|nr:ZIP family metal transporter [Candidatus Saccharimonadales bacterium]
MLAILFTAGMFVSTLLGGWFAIRHKKHLHHILGLTAGVILGVLAFDILPEIFEMTHEFDLDPTWPMVALVAGFLSFHIAEKMLLIHHEHETKYGKHRHPKVGMLSALALGGHSLLDGVGIGLAFQVNATVGTGVAIALVAHKFADGLNTAGLMLAHKNTVQRALIMVVVNALLPIAGALSTLLFTIPEQYLPYYLGFFAGFLLYIGASDILPQAHDEKSDRLTIGLTLLGVLAMFLVTRFALHMH